MNSKSYPNRSGLISAAQLLARLDDPALRIFDTTVDLVPKAGGGYAIASGRTAYDAAHIPGAGFIDVVEDLSDRSHRLNFMMPPEHQFVSRMSALGVGSGIEVVLYNSGPTWWATRVYFMLRAFGFDAVRVLDGGLDCWRLQDLPLSAEACRYPAAQFIVAARRALFVGKEEVLLATQTRGTHLLHALTAQQFSGEVPTYGRHGRIKGSVNVVARDLLDARTQQFLPAAALRQKLAAAGLLDGKPVIAYCGGGISATTDAFALELLGYSNVAIYDASMTEWGPDASLPMERDAPPA